MGLKTAAVVPPPQLWLKIVYFPEFEPLTVEFLGFEVAAGNWSLSVVWVHANDGDGDDDGVP